MTELLCLLLKPALLWEGNPARYWYLTPVALLAWLVDILLCHTAWALAFGWPHPGEVTISHTLERLCVDYGNPDRALFVAIAQKINRLAGRPHIKVLGSDT